MLLATRCCVAHSGARQTGSRSLFIGKRHHTTKWTDGILSGNGDEGKATRLKWIDKKPLRLLWIPAREMNGPKAEVQQMNMTQVGNDVLPDEFK